MSRCLNTEPLMVHCRPLRERASERGVGHAERIIAKELESMGIKPNQVTRIYSELEPCQSPGGYCNDFIRRNYQDAEVTFTFDYKPGDTQSSVEMLKAIQKLQQ